MQRVGLAAQQGRRNNTPIRLAYAFLCHGGLRMDPSGCRVIPYRSANLVQSVTQPAWRQMVMVSLLRNCAMKKISPNPSSSDSMLFNVTAEADSETLLANASETLSSARELASTLAFDLEGSQRSLVLAIHQLVEIGGLLVDRALEQVAPA